MWGCGSYLFGWNGCSHTGKRYFYYKCKKACCDKTCKTSGIEKGILEGIVLDCIHDFLSDSSSVEEASAKLYEEQKRESPIGRASAPRGNRPRRGWPTS